MGVGEANDGYSAARWLFLGFKPDLHMKRAKILSGQDRAQLVNR